MLRESTLCLNNDQVPVIETASEQQSCAVGVQRDVFFNKRQGKSHVLQSQDFRFLNSLVIFLILGHLVS